MQAKIKIKNGYWTYNGVAVKNCPFPIQQLVSSFIKTQVFNNEPIQVPKSDELVIDKSAFQMPDFIPA
jgi:hypothetical protein